MIGYIKESMWNEEVYAFIQSERVVAVQEMVGSETLVLEVSAVAFRLWCPYGSRVCAKVCYGWSRVCAKGCHGQEKAMCNSPWKVYFTAGITVADCRLSRRRRPILFEGKEKLKLRKARGVPDDLAWNLGCALMGYGSNAAQLSDAMVTAAMVNW